VRLNGEAEASDMILTKKCFYITLFAFLLQAFIATLSLEAQEKVSVNAPATPLFAVKTNLLFDALTVVNAEIEVPIGRHFSIAGEWLFPNWVDRIDHRYCMQASVLSAEGRFWFGDRMKHSSLTGFFAGVYGQWGNLDFQPFTQYGWRVNNGWAAGISAGYAHTINRSGSLRLEYSLGLAYAKADYRYYERILLTDGTYEIASKDEWHYNGSIFPVPTKVKVSLVWLISFKNRRGTSN